MSVGRKNWQHLIVGQQHRDTLGGISRHRTHGSSTVPAPYPPRLVLFPCFLHMQAAAAAAWVGLVDTLVRIRRCIESFLVEENQPEQWKGVAGTSYCPSPGMQIQHTNTNTDGKYSNMYSILVQKSKLESDAVCIDSLPWPTECRANGEPDYCCWLPDEVSRTLHCWIVTTWNF